MIRIYMLNMIDTFFKLFSFYFLYIYVVEKNLLNKNLIYVCSAVVGLVIYEIIQYFLDIGTYDLWDIIFTLIGGIIAFLMNKYYYNYES